MTSPKKEGKLEKLSAIRPEDLILVEKLKKLVDTHHGDGFVDEIDDLSSLIDRMVHNLKSAPLYFRKLASDDIDNYFHVKCDCGWFGSSRLLQGGGQIADTGDFGDAYCPVCGKVH